MGERGRIALATAAGAAVTLLVVGTLRLTTGAPIGAEDNGDGYRMFCGVGLRPLTLDGLAAWKGGVVGDFAVGDPSCGMSVPSSAALMLRVAHAVGLGGSMSLVTLAWCYAVLAGVVVGFATWAASAAGPWRAAVLAVPVAPLALPSFSRFFASTYGEPAGLLGTLAVACGVAVLLVVDPRRRREWLIGLALVLGGGGLAGTAKPGFVPVLLVALLVAAAAVLRAPRGTLPWPASRPGRAVVVAATVAVLAAVVVPVAGAAHFQKKIYEGANVHDVVFTMALPELGPEAAADLDLPVAGAAAITGHGFFNGPPRPTDAWWQRAIGERPGALRVDAVLALAREPAALMRTAGVGLQATTRADLPYLADAPADPTRATATAGDVGWSGGRGPELRAVLADTDRPPWLPSAVVLLALAAALSSPAWRTRAPAARRWCVAAGLGAVTTLALVAAALVGDGYFELFKHVWLAAAVLLVTALCVGAGLVAAIASALRRPGGAHDHRDDVVPEELTPDPAVPMIMQASTQGVARSARRA